MSTGSGLASFALVAGVPSIASAQVTNATTNTIEPAPAQDDAGSDEIVVTAQRRSQRITDVPYNISAVSGDSITALGSANANDLVKVVAGLGNFADGPVDRAGENNFSLRGLRTDAVGPSGNVRYTVSSVSTYFGDTPVFFPILLKDLERVEVLRGPQGTLYGSGAQAGAIRFIPARPSFNKISGEVNVSGGSTYSSSRLNGSADAVLNIPLADNLAVRIVGAYVRQAGFIDAVNLFETDANGVPVSSVPGNLSSGPRIAPIRKDVNSSDQWIARAVVRYQPTDWLDLEASYLHQYSNSDDSQVTNPAYAGGTRDLSSGTRPNASYMTRPGGKLRSTQSILQPTTGEIDLFSGTAAFDLGFASLSSITSHYKTNINSVYDGGVGYVNPLFNFVAGYSYYPRFAAGIGIKSRENGFTQEVRLVSSGNSPFSYVVGLYYQRQDRDSGAPFVAPGINAFGASVGLPSQNPQLTDQIYDSRQNFLAKERAAFGELTYRIMDRWQVTGGVRFFKTTQAFDTFQTYPFFGAPYGDGVTQPVSQGASGTSNDASASGQVFKANTSFDIDTDNKIYATYAEGFRRGGANALSSTGPTASLPEFLSFRPDYAYNYEAGIKGRILGRKLTYSLSLYWINQKGFQFNGSTPAFYAGVFNGNKARSRGVEVEGSYRFSPRLTVSGSYTFTDTNVPETVQIFDYEARTLVDDPTPVIILNPNATVTAGSKLPGVSKHSATAAIDYNTPLHGAGSLLVHANANFRSPQGTMIAVASPNYAVLPSVFMADARITYDSGSAWTAGVFVTNLTNAAGYSGTQGVQTPNVAERQSLIYAGKIVATPRTVGVTLGYSF